MSELIVTRLRSRGARSGRSHRSRNRTSVVYCTTPGNIAPNCWPAWRARAERALFHFIIGDHVMSKPLEWPSRERWANSRTFMNREFEQAFESFASEAERAAVMADLETAWRQLGREMQTAKAKGGARLAALLQQPGELPTPYFYRCQLEPEDQALLATYAEPQATRKALKRLMRDWGRSPIPSEAWRKLPGTARLEPLVARYEAKLRAL